MSLSSQLRLLWRRAADNPGLTLLFPADAGRRRRRDRRDLHCRQRSAAAAAAVRGFRAASSCSGTQRRCLDRSTTFRCRMLHFLYAEHSRTLDGVTGFRAVAVGFTDPDNA